MTLNVIIWLIISALLICIDISTSSFIFMWFTIGAFGAIVLAFLEYSVLLQIIVFFVVGIISILAGYPFVKKRFKVEEKKVLTMEESYIGKVMIAQEDIDEFLKIKVAGVYWTAYNKGKKINKGEKFVIVDIEGNKLVVRLKEE